MRGRGGRDLEGWREGGGGDRSRGMERGGGGERSRERIKRGRYRERLGEEGSREEAGRETETGRDG